MSSLHWWNYMLGGGHVTYRTACVCMCLCEWGVSSIIVCNLAHEQSVDSVRWAVSQPRPTSQEHVVFFFKLPWELRFPHLSEEITSQQVFLICNCPFIGYDDFSIGRPESISKCWLKGILLLQCYRMNFLFLVSFSESWYSLKKRCISPADPYKGVRAKILVLIGKKRHLRVGKSVQLLLYRRGSEKPRAFHQICHQHNATQRQGSFFK